VTFEALSAALSTLSMLDRCTLRAEESSSAAASPLAGDDCCPPPSAVSACGQQKDEHELWNIRQRRCILCTRVPSLDLRVRESSQRPRVWPSEAPSISSFVSLCSSLHPLAQILTLRITSSLFSFSPSTAMGEAPRAGACLNSTLLLGTFPVAFGIFSQCQRPARIAVTTYRKGQ